jgi:hypothetical protein
MIKEGILVCLFFTTFNVYAQTWLVDGKELGVTEFDYEYTVITKDQFDRILRSSEQTSVAAMLGYMDNSQAFNTRVKSGQRPQFNNGYYYISVRMLPKTSEGRAVAGYIRNILLYGNSETGAMQISFLDIWGPGSISLKYENNEYRRKFNDLIRIVNDE